MFALQGTPHLFLVDDQGVLHWNGDTRALQGRDVDWGTRTEVTLDALRALPRGDPWLSAGLLKDGDPIYLVKWETGEAVPRLLRIQSVADVDLFGIHGSNYGALVVDRGLWEQRFGLSVASMGKGNLPPADPRGGTAPRTATVAPEPATAAVRAGALAGLLTGHDLDTFFQSVVGPLTGGRVAKWRGPILVEIVRGDRARYGPEVEQAVGELSGVLGPVEIRSVASGGNLRLHFARANELQNVFPEAPLEHTGTGYARAEYAAGAIAACSAVVATNPYEAARAPVDVVASVRRAVLRHELGHCLGLSHNASPAQRDGRGRRGAGGRRRVPFRRPGRDRHPLQPECPDRPGRGTVAESLCAVTGGHCGAGDRSPPARRSNGTGLGGRRRPARAARSRPPRPPAPPSRRRARGARTPPPSRAARRAPGSAPPP